MKQCTKGKRHRWTWDHNRVRKAVRGVQINLCRVSVYRCACGETKVGPLDPNHIKDVS